MVNNKKKILIDDIPELQSKQNKKHHKNIKMIALLSVSITLISMFTTYAYFAIKPSSENQITLLSTGNMSLTFDDNDNGINAELNFGESITKKFTVENTGTVDTSIAINWHNLINTYTNGSLTYHLIVKETPDEEGSILIDESNIPVSHRELKQALSSEVSVPVGQTYYFDLVITLNNTDFDQTADLNAIFQTQFSVGEPAYYIYYYLGIDPNEGTWEDRIAPVDVLLQKGENAEIPDPTREGYTFAGWKIIEGSGEIENNFYTMGIEDTILQAQWTPNKYKISIDLGNGNTEEKEITFNEPFTINLPDYEGHTYAGWELNNDTGIGENGYTENETGQITSITFLMDSNPKESNLKFLWEKNNYAYIVYHHMMNVNGEGYFLQEADTYMDASEFESEVTIEPNEYEGFTLPEAQTITIGVDDEENPINNVINFYYERNKYNVTINTDGGEYPSETTFEMYFESIKTLEVPTKTGYNFIGWEPTSGNLTDNNFMIFAEDAELIAIYEPKEVSVILNANGGIVDPQSTLVIYDDYLLGYLPDAEYEDFEFLGWFTDPVNGEQITEETMVDFTEEKTLYAHWRRIFFNVVYNGNGGLINDKNQDTIKIYHNSEIGDSEILNWEAVLEDSKFIGWFTDPNEGTQITENTPIIEGQKIYAHWEKPTNYLVSKLLSLANAASIINYNSGNKKEMYTFSHSATKQTEALTDYRYIGNTPNNYIEFNNESWRIIGIFNAEGENNIKEQRIKIMRETSIGNLAWNSNNINEWPASSLSTLLNSGDYYNRTGTYSTNGLTETAKSQIAPVKWFLGGYDDKSNAYDYERGLTVISGRKTHIIANVGIMYPSDHLYTYNYEAGSSWSYISANQWTISPHGTNATCASMIGNDGKLYGGHSITDKYVIRPCVYLRSNIEITSGDGSSSNPYKLKS